MIKLEPLSPQPFTEDKFLEYLRGISQEYPEEFDFEDFIQNRTAFLYAFEGYQYINQFMLEAYNTEIFNGDWREGKEIRKVVITRRLYQISPNSTQA